ncbi:MAG: hypothetical protein M3N93_01700 [Acidobacteriota bacterium]|nr:hypothetical protein [Acidobacteriota bacterium]
MLLPSPAMERIPSTNSGEKARVIARVLPSLTDIAFLLPLAFIFMTLSGARTLLGDGDTGWHIRTGEWILANHRVPYTDMFSFSRPGEPWFAWEWLSDVVLAELHSAGGLAAVVFASIALICVTSALIFRLIRRECGNSLVAIAVTLLATGGCAIHWLARPHLFTLLFLAITLHVTTRAAEGRTKLLAWLVPLTLLWTNLHAGFFVIFLVFACYVGGILLNAAMEPAAARRVLLLQSLKPWLLTAGACFAVTFLNPYGWQLHKHLAEYIADPYQMKYIAEFQSINFHSPAVVCFEPLMAMAFFTAMWDARCRRFSDCLLALGWLHMSLIAQRNAPLFAIAASPFIARGIVALVEAASERSTGVAGWIPQIARSFRTSSAGFEQIDRLWRVHFASALPLLAIGLLLFAPRPASARFMSTYDPAAYPEKAIPALLSPETRHIFADDEWGDYLVFSLYPSKRVFIDGRSDFYGDDFGERYVDLLNVKYGWEKTLARYDIDTILLSPRTALASTLKISRDWRVAYDDGVAVIFRRVAQSPEQVSPVSSNGGKARDRATAKQSLVTAGSLNPQSTGGHTK